MSKEVAEEYASSLSDLTVNSKPLINMLTILAEENIDHAGVIVETVEKHLEKVHPDIKLPVLYLVDSIIKNVGGAYTQKFSQSIVNMFTRTFRQVDEKVRSQMFKLRETWHDVFPATKLYQLDVKVNLIDPAWPIQAQPQQSNIHPAPTTSTAPVLSEEDEKMRSILAKKEQELLMLQQKKVEMELERMRRQVEMAEKSVKKSSTLVPSGAGSPSMPVALVNPVMASKTPAVPVAQDVVPMTGLSAKQRLGPVVPKTGNRIAPVSGALAAARRDPRLARRPAPAATPTPITAPAPSLPGPLAAIAPNVFDIKPLERVTKRKNVITIDVQPEADTVAPRDPRRRDPRLEKRDPRRPRPREERDRRRERGVRPEPKADPQRVPAPAYDAYKPLDAKKISKLPPIPKINRDEAKRDAPAPKKKKDAKAERKKKREEAAAKDANETERPEKPAKESSDSTESSPEKKRVKELRAKREKEIREREGRRAEAEEPKATEPEVVAFKELRNFNRERYRRNRDASESPEPARAEPDPPNVPDVIVENKDVDLRVLPVIAETKAAPVAQKRPSTEAIESKSKKNKLDKFDVLFGNEDVDLRQLPQVEEVNAPPPPAMSPKSDNVEEKDVVMTSPTNSPKQKDWNEVKNKTDEVKKTPSNLDLVRAKLAEATKGKDRLGRPLLFCKSPSVERERRRTMSSDDTDLRVEAQEDFDENKKSISIIMSQAKEHLHDGQLDKNQYNTLMYQVLQLNEKLKLKEAKQRESLEISKRKLKAHINDENHKVPSPKSSPNERNTFGDIDERITPAAFIDTPPDSQGLRDSDMRVNSDVLDGHKTKGLLPLPPCMPMFPYNPPMWRGSNQPRPRVDEFGPRRFRGPMPPYFRGKFDKRAMRPPFDPRMPLPMLPTPQIGMCQSESPLQPYMRSESPPPLGAPGFIIPPTDLRVIEYIDQDPFKTIQIDGIPREIRFYGDRAIIMLDWDDPREIQFLPGCRRVTFDNKDSIVLNFNEGYKQVEIDDQVFDIKFGAPTRELFINGRWFECFFGGQPYGVIIDGKPRLVQLEGPMPQVDIGKQKRLDLVAGKINLIVNATEIHPMYLDAKPQKVLLKDMGLYVTLRFVDSLRTILINDQPFKIEYGGLPKPVLINGEKFFIRFSALPKNVKPGFIQIANMEGEGVPVVPRNMPIVDIDTKGDCPMDVVEEPVRPPKTPSPDPNHESLGLDMLASVMPASEVPASSSEYSLAEPLFTKQDRIPGLETPMDEKPANPILPILGNLNVTDLFAKLVATGIVQVPEAKVEATDPSKVEEVKNKPKEDRNVVHKVDMLRLETLRVKQPALVAKLYGGMQCSGCGARFPPEHTVRYSQHLDWHFRQNRRDRDSARRAHSRHWHYDLSDWLQYEEVEDLEEREKSWFETGSNAAGPEGEAEPVREVAHEVPSAAARAPADHTCALCGDLFQQFYNEDKEEWHLRNSLKHDDDYYHPQCYDDYKASLTKEEPEKEVEELPPPVEKIEEPIEIKDVDDTLDQSDNESVVEVVEEKREVESVEIDEGDEDDVVFKPEPVVQVVVDDDADTDDETTATRAERDRQAEIDFSQVKVKQEPVDPDDEPIITAEEASVQTTIDSTHATVESSIDGNVRLDASELPPTTLPVGGIRINISKSLPTFMAPQEDKMLDDVSADDEPLPPGEELEMEYALKPSMVGREFSRQPPVMKGSEISALCSIM